MTSKYYLGMHSTYNLNDGYIGSGKRLWYSINKYGKENHVCEILEHYFTREWLGEREAELVNETTLSDPNCMNLKVGGDGGWSHVLSDMEKHRVTSSSGGKKGIKTLWDKIKNDPTRLAEHRKRSSKHMKNLHGTGLVKYDTFSGRKHRPETIEKMKLIKCGHGVGSSNSQYGTCWVFSTSKKISKKIKKYELLSYAIDGWELGRKFKF